MSMSTTLKNLNLQDAEESAYDQIAPNAEQENRDAEAEGAEEAEKFVYSK